MGVYVDTVTLSYINSEGPLDGTTLNASDLGDVETDYTIVLPLLPPETLGIELLFDFDAGSFPNPMTGETTFREDVDMTTTDAPDGEILEFTVPGLGFVVTYPSGTAGFQPEDFVVAIANSDPVPGAEFSIDVEGLDLPTNTITLNFVVGSSPTEFSITCFAAGTGIATPQGERAVERLGIGDPILTADGRIVRVKWVGRQTVSKLFTPAERFAPVRITAGALGGGGLPRRDLVLTADHALMIEGLLVQAGALVNGTTIVRVPMADLPAIVTYYHIETKDHDLLLAEGTPAETFIDNVTRETFDNYAEFETLYSSAPPQIAEMDAPRVMSRRQLPSHLRARLGLTRAA